MQATPEIGKSIRAGGVLTNSHEAGKGTPVILIHGCKCKLYPALVRFGYWWRSQKGGLDLIQ